jgi:hypothetical protein
LLLPKIPLAILQKLKTCWRAAWVMFVRTVPLQLYSSSTTSAFSFNADNNLVLLWSYL